MFAAVEDEFLIFAENVERRLGGVHDDCASGSNHG
jgi:hypothetical protein